MHYGLWLSKAKWYTPVYVLVGLLILFVCLSVSVVCFVLFFFVIPYTFILIVTLLVASLTKLVSSRPRDSSETFLLSQLVGHRPQSPVR